MPVPSTAAIWVMLGYLSIGTVMFAEWEVIVVVMMIRIMVVMMADSTPEQTKPLVQVARSALARLCCTVGKEKVNPRWCSFSSPRRLCSNMKSLSLSAMKLNRFSPGPTINSSLTGCLAAFILTLVLLLSNSTKITLKLVPPRSRGR